MNLKEAEKHLIDYFRAVAGRFGSRQILGGHAEELVAGVRITVLWLEGDEDRAIGYYLSKYLGQGNFHAEAKLFDTPRPRESLPSGVRAAIESVQSGEIVGIRNVDLFSQFTSRAGSAFVHGNN